MIADGKHNQESDSYHVGLRRHNSFFRMTRCSPYQRACRIQAILLLPSASCSLQRFTFVTATLFNVYGVLSLQNLADNNLPMGLVLLASGTTKASVSMRFQQILLQSKMHVRCSFQNSWVYSL